ncbi:MAG TPA: proton-conducting transporter membrane subunit [Candidatus Saccharimonadales bacterium]|nr:proton-conducting transporter membrane subunit [Candidatus Saccharimonadales bacterium]
MELLCLLITPVLAIVLLLTIKRQRRLLEIVSITSAIIEVIAGLFIIHKVIIYHWYVMSLFAINAFGAFVLGLTILIGFIATLHSVGYLRGEQEKEMIGFKRVRECYILMRLFLVCMFVAITTASPIVMWIAIEATTLSTVFLISFFNRKADIEAAWKYLIINSVGLLLGLLGTLLFLAQGVSSPGIITWTDFISAAPHMNMLVSKFAFIFIMIGYGTKMGLVPMHTWRPDTYNKAPLPIVALLSGALLNVAFFAILHFKLIIDSVVGVMFSQTLFLFFGLISIAIPALIIYSQVNYKRLLAYSSIEHAGIMLLGFGFGGIGVLGAILHMMYHAFGKSLLFFVSSNIALKYSSSKIKDVRGMLTVMPYSSVLYIIGFLAIVGIPPFGMFFSELYIVIAGFRHNPVITLIAIIFILLVFAGFFRHVFAMLFGAPPEGIKKGEINMWTILPISVLALLLIVIGLYIPNPLQILINESVAIFH